jgi:hypothetical protein
VQFEDGSEISTSGEFCSQALAKLIVVIEMSLASGISYSHGLRWTNVPPTYLTYIHMYTLWNTVADTRAQERIFDLHAIAWIFGKSSVHLNL